MAAANLYIRKMGTYTTKSGATLNYPTKDIQDFGFYLKSIDYPLSAEVKDQESNTFFDEDGDEEWAAPRLYLKAYEASIELCTKGTKSEIYERIYRLREYLIGADGTGTHEYIYSDWHDVGMCDARLVKLGDKIEYADLGNGEFVVGINMSIKVNDPVGEVVMGSDGEIRMIKRVTALLEDSEGKILADSEGYLLATEEKEVVA